MNKNPRSMGETNFDHLVYVRLFEGCNLACSHCFIPANPKKMTEEQLRDLPGHFARFARHGDRILIQWHGGEPTLLGPDIIRSTIEHWQKTYRDYQLSFGIQTNLVNYDQSWKALYQDHFDSRIGISWDPEIRLTRKDKPETNDAFEQIFWKNAKALRDDGITPYLVVTGTRIFFERFRNPHAFFQLMEEYRIPSGHIERLTKTGVARQHWDKIGVSNQQYSRYMLAFARAYKEYLGMPRKPENMPVRLSPFDGLFESLERLKNGQAGGSGCLSGVCDTRFHTFDANGYKKGCTAVTSEFDNKNAGTQVIQIMNFSAARKIRQQSCVGCPYMPICSSGCLATDKWDESGECSGGKILFSGAERLAYPQNN